MSDDAFRTVTVEAAEGGWIVRVKGKPTQIYSLWRKVVERLEQELTHKLGEVSDG